MWFPVLGGGLCPIKFKYWGGCHLVMINMNFVNILLLPISLAGVSSLFLFVLLHAILHQFLYDSAPLYAIVTQLNCDILLHFICLVMGKKRPPKSENGIF